MDSFEPSGVIKAFRTGSSELTLWFPGNEIAAARVVGRIRSAVAAAAYAEIDRYTAAQGFPGRGFIDLSGMEEFDWESRMILIRWNVAHRKQAAGLDLFAWSNAARLGLRLLSRALGDLVVSHQERETFNASYKRALTRSSASASEGVPTTPK
jgi:hypothetical protein